MSTKWKVNEGTQVARGDKMHGPGDTFTATEGEVRAEGIEGYVTKADAPKAEADTDADAKADAGLDPKQQAQPKAENKAVGAPEARSTQK